jgi:hypothetical protein
LQFRVTDELPLRSAVYANSLLSTLNAKARWGLTFENELDKDGDQWEIPRQASVRSQDSSRKHRLGVRAAHLHSNGTRTAGVGANASKSSFSSDVAGEYVEEPSSSYKDGKSSKGRFGDITMDITVEAETIVMEDMPVQMH